MAQFFGDHFPILVLGTMLTFILVLGGLSIEDAIRGPRD